MVKPGDIRLKEVKEVLSPQAVPARQPSLPRAIAATGASILTGLLVIGLGWVAMWQVNVRLTPDPVAEAHQAKLAARQALMNRYAHLGPSGPTLDPVSFARGKQLYAIACTACHGSEARGVTGLGKDLVDSSFSRKLSNPQLAAFIAKGRTADDPLNTTRVPMPPRGGRTDLADSDLADVVTYLRGLQDPRVTPEEPLPVVTVAQATAPVAPAEPAKPASAETAKLIASQAIDNDAALRGKKVFSSCMACHGKDGKGVKNTGKDLIHSEFVATQSNAQLLAFIKKGRDPGDPASTMKLAMPAKGGNPALNDAKIADVIQYIRSLQKAEIAKK